MFRQFKLLDYMIAGLDSNERKKLRWACNGKYKFLWITDGMGWKETKKPLRETFNHNDHLFNLAMLEKGILEFLLIKDQ